MRIDFGSALRLAVGATLVASASLVCAQSSVTLYGLVDAGLQYASKTADATKQNAGSSFSLTNGGNGPSLFGLKGKEDLGGGLSATFTLESGIDLSNGGYNSSNGNFWGRQAWVGLEGNLGKVRLGAQFSPFLLAIWDADPRHFDSFGSGIIIYGDNAAFTGAVTANAITYMSPKLWGFEAIGMFALGGVAGNFQAGRQWSASLKYDNGGLMVNTSIFSGNAGGTPTPVPTTLAFLGRMVGVAYRFGFLTTKASFVNYKVAGSFNSNVFSGGFDYYITPALNLNGGVWISSDRNQTSNNSILAAVGTTYFLSKATSVYAQFGGVNNHGKMDTGLSITDHILIYGVKGTTLGANFGIRHAF